MVMKPLVLRGGRVLQTGDTRPACLDLVIGTDGRIAALTPPCPCHAVCGRSTWRGGSSPQGSSMRINISTRRARGTRLPNPTGTLAGAITAFRTYAAQHMGREEIMERAERTLTACLIRGTVAIRSHANVDPTLAGVYGGLMFKSP